ncbi:glucose dehydrogenase [Halobacteriales archaeon SW_10_68_16]|jgi:threonine dehydrogenase-like Zn-dependent dehydrogenase|nr:MAG: glucose dehydrogenase [Halobacteriales archaeon SW_10_68_16]
MQAIGIERGADSPGLVDVPPPERGAGEALVRTLRVGVDGTDHEVIAGHHGGPPAGEDYLVLGHEAVGVVEASDGDFETGDVVVPTVRRPPNGEENRYFERGEADMAPPGAALERGIDGAHGFMSEYFTSPAECLVELPADLARWGFLVEPVSISEKALELAYASRSSFGWEPKTALVLGNGSLGLLTVAMLVEDYEVYCVGRRDRPDPTIDIIERLGATYVDSRETPVDEFAEIHGPADIVYEATGYAKHAVRSVPALGPNGVAALLGVPGPWTFDIDGGRLHKDIVMHNKAIVGSVNSGPRHFRAAVGRLADMPEWFLEDLVTRVVSVEEFGAAFEESKTTIKTAVEFES